jgi:hypothetical protein
VGAARAPRPPVGFRLQSFWVLLVSVLICGGGCAARRFERPTGPSTPAPEAAAAWQTATARCRGVRTAHATMRLVFRAGPRRFPAVMLGAAFDGDARAMALEARVGSAAFFVLGGTADQATLVLRDGRYVRAPAADIVAALIDVRLEPGRLLAILTGCLTPTPEFRQAVRRDRVLEVTADDAVAYLEQSTEGGWRVRAGSFDSLDVDYGTPGPSWPRSVEIRSRAETSKPAMSITISRLEITQPNESIDPSVFQPVLPPGATSISLAELRAAGPAGAAAN